MSNKTAGEILDKFGINYVAINGSTDDVDIIDRDIEKLIDQALTDLKALLKSKMSSEELYDFIWGECEGDDYKTKKILDQFNQVIDEVFK